MIKKWWHKLFKSEAHEGIETLPLIYKSREFNITDEGGSPSMEGSWLEGW